MYKYCYTHTYKQRHTARKKKTKLKRNKSLPSKITNTWTMFSSSLFCFRFFFADYLAATTQTILNEPKTTGNDHNYI